ncbi:MAG: PhzF family phenazine biosynthesis protein [Phycisphaeraceae bacterium]|nr:PhzF family phenazine biosynthesis protein [Phycisphaeraceae bacterium]
MRIDLYQIDAFTAKPFAGNPAAVCPLPYWIDDQLLHAIAAENNLSETAFFVADGKNIELRWWTPIAEVDLCGHATLAAAHVLFHHRGHEAPTIHFHTRSGILSATRSQDGIELDFPGHMPLPCTIPPDLNRALNIKPTACLKADDYIVVYEKAEQVQALEPDMPHLARLGLRGVAATARGPRGTADYVCRCFFPKLGVKEDPVTGSAHCQLAPYWADRLERRTLIAHQLSHRGGELTCKVKGERVLLIGSAVDYLVGTITIPDP